MTVTAFNDRKNKILRTYSGIGHDLIPKDQNCEIELTQKQVAELSVDNESDSCLYCLVYSGDCEKCPMGKKGNICSSRDTTTTWGKYCSEVKGLTHTSATSDAYEPMAQLIDQFKDEFEEAL